MEKMERKVRIFLVCALGTMAGLAVAWFVPQIIWWLGALVGCAASGLLYALPEIRHYAPRAARIVWATLCYLPKIWQGIISLRKASALTKWRVVAAIMLVGVVGSLLATAGLVKQVSVVIDVNESLLGFLLLVGICYWGFFFNLLLIGSFQNKTEEIKKQRAKRVVLFVSPIGPPIAVVWLIVKAIKVAPVVFAVAVGIMVDIGRFLWRFSKTLYIFIHSRELVLCTMDGGLGVLISYFLCVRALNLAFGPTLLVGGLIGGILGILNYEIVSKHVLHLAPKKS